MKLVLSGTYSGVGGIQSHLHWLAKAALESGFSVRILSLGLPLEASDHERAARLSALGDFHLTDVAQAEASTKGRFLACLRELRQTRPDIYLACGTGWNLFLPAAFSFACKRRVFHEVMSGESSGRKDTRGAVRLFFTDVVAQASPVGANFARTFRWRHPIRVLPAFPEPLELSASLPPVTKHLSTNSLPRAAFFSRLVPHKRGLWLVRQWPRLRSCLSELHIYGGGPEEEPIRTLIRENGWSDRVFCHGRYPDGQAYVDLICSFDMTLLPTVGAEGAPLVLLESMACGVPFVSTDAGGIPDYANPDCLITPMASDESFLSAIESLSDRLRRGEIDQPRLRNHYLDHFSFRALSEKWISYFSSLQRGNA